MRLFLLAVDDTRRRFPARCLRMSPKNCRRVYSSTLSVSPSSNSSFKKPSSVTPTHLPGNIRSAVPTWYSRTNDRGTYRFNRSKLWWSPTPHNRAFKGHRRCATVKCCRLPHRHRRLPLLRRDCPIGTYGIGAGSGGVVGATSAIGVSGEFVVAVR